MVLDPSGVNCIRLLDGNILGDSKTLVHILFKKSFCPSSSSPTFPTLVTASANAPVPVPLFYMFMFMLMLLLLLLILVMLMLLLLLLILPQLLVLEISSFLPSFLPS